MIDAATQADTFLFERVEGHVAGNLIGEIPQGGVQHFAGLVGDRTVDIDVETVGGAFYVSGCTFGLVVGP